MSGIDIFLNGRKKRKRDQYALQNLMSENDDNLMSNEEPRLMKVSFQNGDEGFYVDEKTPHYRYFSCNNSLNYDKHLIGSPDYWHQIIIHHNRVANCIEEVLPLIYRIVGEDYFAPIGYQSGRFQDHFYVHNQGRALEKIFSTGLTLELGRSQRNVFLAIKMCVAQFKRGMLNVPSIIRKIMEDSIDLRLSSLNISHLRSHQALNDVMFSLSNFGCFTLLSRQLRDFQTNSSQTFDTLNLSGNGISTLEPLHRLSKFLSLDIRHNDIRSPEDLQFIQHLCLKELFLNGNTVTDIPMFTKILRSFLPTVRTTDLIDVELSSAQESQVSFDNRSEAIRTVNNGAISVQPADVNDHAKKNFFKMSNKSWNKVVVKHDGKASKKTILEEMSKQFFNRIPFFPCYYEQGRTSDSFLLINNFEALNAMVQRNLKMKIASNGVVLEFQLFLKYAEWVDGHVNWRQKVNYVIQKLITGSSLKLDNISSDPDFDKLYVSLSTFQGFLFIINAAKNMNDEITSMSLKRNDISNPEGFILLDDFPNLVSLDIRNNSFENFEGFPSLPGILEIFLDGNPVCKKYYNDPRKYVEEICKIFPNLQYIDGHRIDNESQLVCLQNFFVSPKSYTLIESYITYFFNLYDSSDRQCLKNLYQEDSLFTLSSNLPEAFIFKDYSRNLLDHDPYGDRKVFIGTNEIIELFKFLSQTQHDFTTMCVDVPMFTNKIILINVSGYFNTVLLNGSERLYAFTRSFVLERKNQVSGALKNTFEFRVKNETLQLRNPSFEGRQKAFKKKPITVQEIQNICQDLMPSSDFEEDADILMMSKLTNLNEVWCRRLLEEADWNIKLALRYVNDFIDRAILIEDDFVMN